jgi:hypothetical protein
MTGAGHTAKGDFPALSLWSWFFEILASDPRAAPDDAISTMSSQPDCAQHPPQFAKQWPALVVFG